MGFIARFSVPPSLSKLVVGLIVLDIGLAELPSVVPKYRQRRGCKSQIQNQCFLCGMLNCGVSNGSTVLRGAMQSTGRAHITILVHGTQRQRHVKLGTKDQSGQMPDHCKTGIALCSDFVTHKLCSLSFRQCCSLSFRQFCNLSFRQALQSCPFLR
jgi:hypothetical protein